MEYIEFPKWLFHKTESAVIVKNKDEESEMLGKGYSVLSFSDEPTVVDEAPSFDSEEVPKEKLKSKKGK